jgi:hypothetical protein
VRRFVFKPQWILGHLMVVVAACACIRLADWQLSRAHITEALQNWGYALQWPLFSAFFLIGWWRMLRLESIRLDEIEAEEADAEAAGAGPATPEGATPDGDLSGAAAPLVSKAQARRQSRQRPPLTAPLLTPSSDPAHENEGSAGGVRAGCSPADAEDEQHAAYNRMLARLAAQDAARGEAGRR